jgi:hypothetical protein
MLSSKHCNSGKAGRVSTCFWAVSRASQSSRNMNSSTPTNLYRVTSQFFSWIVFSYSPPPPFLCFLPSTGSIQNVSFFGIVRFKDKWWLADECSPWNCMAILSLKKINFYFVVQTCGGTKNFSSSVRSFPLPPPPQKIKWLWQVQIIPTTDCSKFHATMPEFLLLFVLTQLVWGKLDMPVLQQPIWSIIS